MGLFAEHLDQPQYRRMMIDSNRLLFALYEQEFFSFRYGSRWQGFEA